MTVIHPQEKPSGTDATTKADAGRRGMMPPSLPDAIKAGSEAGGGAAALSPGTAALPEVMIGVVQGDRACHACAFNLRGQPIVRERHYGMVMLRCPECGTVGPITEYPVASGAARRVGYILSMFWLALVLLICLIVGIWAAGAAQLGKKAALDPVAITISEKFIEYAKADAAKQAQAGVAATNTWSTWVASQAASSMGWIDGAWWATQTNAAWLSEARAMHRPFSRKLLPMWFRASVLLLPAGMILACLFPHLRRPALILVALGVLPVGAIFLWLLGTRSSSWGGMGTWGQVSIELASNVVGFRATAIQLAMLLPSLTLGVCIGRPVARLLIIWLLPPRLRLAYSFLWLADGKPLPKPR